MRGLEEEGIAIDLGFKMALVFDCEASLLFVTANQILLDFRFHRQLFICLCLLHVIGLFNYRFEDQSFLCYKVECVLSILIELYLTEPWYNLLLDIGISNWGCSQVKLCLPVPVYKKSISSIQ